jgi:hypothetical protein
MQILRDHADAVGRDEPIDVCFSPFAEHADEVVDELHSLETLGVTWAVLHGPPAESRAAWIDGAHRLGEKIIGAYRAGRS